MGWLLLITLVVVLIVALVFVWPRWRARAASPATEPASLLRASSDDPDQVDEAAAVISAIGGQVRPGDAATIQIADPAPWGLASFELDVSVAAVSRAEIRDASGLFSFMLYWMPAQQEAALVTVEGDVPALAEVFVGRYLADRALTDTLLWCRDQYLADHEYQELTFDLGEHGVGSWTAFAAREGGRLSVESGTAPLLPAGAAMGDGLPYRDCLFHPGRRDDPARLRLVQIGTFAYAFQGEIVPLPAISILRRTRGEPTR
jgi:hypothetical protein